MRGIILSAAIVVFLSVGGFAKGQDGHAKEPSKEVYRKVNNQAFAEGEFLKYKLAYGILNAGTATLEVKKADKKIQNREMYHIVGKGKSISAFDWFFKVRDSYETYIDTEGIFPWLFVRRINEGGYKKEQDYMFYQHKGFVKNEKKEEYNVPHGIQDMLSSFYYARTIDFSNAKKGDVFEFNAFVDEEVYPLRIKYLGTKKVKIKAGKFNCMMFSPVVQEGRIFEDDDDLTVYITKDENKIPILAKAKILVGSVRMELTEYKNLKNPVALVD